MRQVFGQVFRHDLRQGKPGSTLEWCLTAATAAPSVHNTQPWLFRPHRGGIDVYADRSRQLTVVDPDGRELVLSVGAAVLNLRLAVLRLGRVPELRLRPRPDVPDLLARVVPGGPAPVSRTVRSLAAAIRSRRSNRWPFTGMAVPTVVQAELVAAAAAEGAVLIVTGPGFRRTVLDAVGEADRYWCADADYRRELAGWTASAPDRQDGITVEATGPRPATGAVPLRDLGLARSGTGRAIERPTMDFEDRPTIAVLYTADTPIGWLRAGQALQRVLLTATVRGLSTTLLTQPLEIPRFRTGLTDPAVGRPAQAVIRLGYSRHEPAVSPRRTLADVLLGGDAA